MLIVPYSPHYVENQAANIVETCKQFHGLVSAERLARQLCHLRLGALYQLIDLLFAVFFAAELFFK